ncbi:MAG TPA: hypothetical protein PLG99_11830 [Kaistiaceae bacterium]|nr:hypothetical protein [Kaistiaceae bacterium]
MVRFLLFVGALALGMAFLHTGRIDVVPLPLAIFALTTGVTLWGLAKL